MKILCSDHVDIAAPAERAFDFVADISRWPVWFSPVVSAQHPESLPVALDEELLLCLHCGRRRWHESFEVTRFVRNAFLSLEGAFSAARRIDFRFEQRAAHTRIACTIGYPVFGIVPAIVDAAIGRHRVKRELRDSLAHLKGLLEHQVEPGMAGDDIFHEAVSPAKTTLEPLPSNRMKEPAGAL